MPLRASFLARVPAMYPFRFRRRRRRLANSPFCIFSRWPADNSAPIQRESQRGIQLFHGGRRDFFLLFAFLLGFLSRWDEEEVIFSFSSCRFNQIKWKKRNSFDYCLLVVSVSLERVVGFSKILYALFSFFRIVNVDASSPGEIFF